MLEEEQHESGQWQRKSPEAMRWHVGSKLTAIYLLFGAQFDGHRRPHQLDTVQYTLQLYTRHTTSITGVTIVLC